MKFAATRIPGVIVIEPEPRRDERGFFERRFCAREFEQAAVPSKIVQINRSRSVRRGTVRGLHYQLPPMGETKIVQCLRGRVFDVAVDLRTDSPTYLSWHGEVLDEENGRALCIPRGCAHGFQSLVDDAEVLYFTDQFYSPEHERTVNFADARIGIKWPVAVTVVSAKDRGAPQVEATSGIASTNR
jgi:dTDP-4-dehydrorhamnose 3,5-epimerase